MTMIEDRRHIATARSMEIVLGYERLRTDQVFDVSEGRTQEAMRIRAATEGLDITGVQLSADVVAGRGSGSRVIEVKSRGSTGPVEILDRQKWTFEVLGQRSWLYVVWNVTQPQDYELWAVQDPDRMPWVMTRQNERERGDVRGTQHEGKWKIRPEDISRFGERLDLARVPFPPKDDIVVNHGALQ